MVPHYITQDGPSHVYTAVVAESLILHPHGLYASVYRLQPRLVSNWCTTLLLGALVPVFGADHAEAALASVSVFIAFAALSYFRRSLSRAGHNRADTPLHTGHNGADTPLHTGSSWSSCDPLTNFLIDTWFLWGGYYNFYLGMALCMFLIGVYVRYADALTPKRIAYLAAGLVLLFFTHALGAAPAVMAIALMLLNGFGRLDRAQRMGAAFALAPVVILLGFFLKGYSPRQAFHPEIGRSWGSFPMHVFASARGRAGEEALLVPAMIFFLATGLLAIRRAELTRARLSMAMATAVSFGGYLFLPDTGFGGDFIKIRLAWAVFLFGCPLAASVTRMKFLRVPVSVYIACCVAANLVVTCRIERSIGRAAASYEAALEAIPEGSALARMNYGIQGAKDRYGFDAIASDPLFHADALVAARRNLIDLTDYQAPNRAFPVTFQKRFTGTQQSRLYRLEVGESAGLETLKDIANGLPVRVDYIVLVGDDGSEMVRHSDFSKTLAWLGDTSSLVSEADSFVRVYRR